MKLLPVNVNIHDQAKLQRGAKLYMNYCSGCHSLRYVRYSRLANDLGLVTFAGKPDINLINNLIFTGAKIEAPVKISMPATDAREWFGLVPPDLSLTARERGAAWIYTYLKSFYADSSRPFGANNLLVPDVAMPNILAPLIGHMVLVNNPSSPEKPADFSLVLKDKGEMGQQQFNEMLEDLVTFLVYVGEPVKLIRYRLGFWVIGFLSIFLLVVYSLKKVIWKNS
ncbi:cytochrome c1 [Legionella fairfieldensis]|uniref:cytochrome c1 n=1 Tax=Legionella fairfieldensis TaxID=45064 RepID=UPI000A024740|nr:cytochrome c1 [Legionella fairfieldensis]